MSDTLTPRERAEALINDFLNPYVLTPALADRIERAITAAEQVAREDERIRLAETIADIETVQQAAFRRGAEAMRGKIETSLAVIGDMDLAINAVRQASPPQPAGGGE